MLFRKKEAPADGSAQAGADGGTAGRRPSKKILLAAAVVLLALAAVLMLRLRGAGRSASAAAEYRTEAAEARTIVQSITGSGTLQPANSYTVTAQVTGDILSADFEEGDIVEKDAVLYEIDSSDAMNNIEKSSLTLAQAQRSYDSTADTRYARAEFDGTVYTIGVAVGDKVTKGQEVAVLRDSTVMELVVPFPSADAAYFAAGQEATVLLDGTFEQLRGTVTSVSGSDVLDSGNVLTRSVTIAVANPGSLQEGQAASAQIGGVDSTQGAAFACQRQASVTAPAAGTVTQICVSEGSPVTDGTVLLVLGGDELEESVQTSSESLRSAELAMESSQDTLDDYTIRAPIRGTIVEKLYKQGEATEKGESVCTIYDMSYLEMTIDVDELDIRSVAVGQPVTITADADTDTVYNGVITRVSVAGKTTGGVTSYPVTVRIDETGDLLPGMNANAEIVVEQVQDALAVPCDAVQRGGLVLVTKDSPSAANAVEDAAAPDGYAYVEVTTGASDDEYIQIVDGLQEGDTIAYVPQTSSDSDWPTGGVPGGGIVGRVAGRGGAMG